MSSNDTPMKKRILFLEQQSWLSGAQRVLETVLDSIAPEFEPLVAFPDCGEFCKKLQKRSIGTLIVPLGAYQSGQKSILEMLAFAGRSLWCGLKLASVIRKKRIDLIYINGPRCLPAGVLASILTGRPAVFHLHLTLCRKPEVALVAHLARRVARVISCSRAAAQPLVDADPRLASKIQIFNNPVIDRSRPTAGVPMEAKSPTQFTLGMVGRITETKGQERLLNAVGALPAALRDKIRVMFVGAPAPGNLADLAYSRRLRRRGAQVDLPHEVLWTGYQEDPTPFYASMDALVQPSAANAGEAMPLAVLEALREGIPVIASRTGGIPEVVQDGENGLLVPPGDESALTRALQRFIEDYTLRARLREGARVTLTQQFSVEDFRLRIRALIEELAGAATPGKADSAPEELAACN
jgi:glycosyltransferase involved in cell wall biosynthesis